MGGGRAWRRSAVGLLALIALASSACGSDDAPAATPGAPTTATTSAPSGKAFCPLLEQAITAQLRLLQDVDGLEVDATLDAILSIDSQLTAAAPASLRAQVATYTDAAAAMVANVHARTPDPSQPMRTPSVQSASRALYDYGTTTCHIEAATS